MHGISSLCLRMIVFIAIFSVAGCDREYIHPEDTNIGQTLFRFNSEDINKYLFGESSPFIVEAEKVEFEDDFVPQYSGGFEIALRYADEAVEIIEDFPRIGVMFYQSISKDKSPGVITGTLHIKDGRGIIEKLARTQGGSPNISVGLVPDDYRYVVDVGSNNSLVNDERLLEYLSLEIPNYMKGVDGYDSGRLASLYRIFRELSSKS